MKRFILSAFVLLYIFLTLGATWQAASPAPMETPIATATPNLTPEPIELNPYEVTLIAKTLYGEAPHCSKTEQAAVVWCILNRVDTVDYGMGVSVEHVVTFAGQFAGYSPNNPALPELYAVASDVLTRYEREKRGETDVGRVLPREFKWFSGDNYHNYFRDSYSGGNTWGWTMASPYEVAL